VVFLALIIALDIAVLALSVSVNVFQEFFCESPPARVRSLTSVLINATVEADLFPFFLSIITLVILLLQCVTSVLDLSTGCSYILPTPSFHRIVFDFVSENAFTARPAFEIPLLGTLTIAWLGEICRFF
jgi:hypothetical protein